MQSGAHIQEIVLALGIGYGTGAVFHDDAHAGDAHVPVALAGHIGTAALRVHPPGNHAAVVKQIALHPDGCRCGVRGHGTAGRARRGGGLRHVVVAERHPRTDLCTVLDTDRLTGRHLTEGPFERGAVTAAGIAERFTGAGIRTPAARAAARDVAEATRQLTGDHNAGEGTLADIAHQHREVGHVADVTQVARGGELEREPVVGDGTRQVTAAAVCSELSAFSKAERRAHIDRCTERVSADVGLEHEGRAVARWNRSGACAVHHALQVRAAPAVAACGGIRHASRQRIHDHDGAG